MCILSSLLKLLYSTRVPISAIPSLVTRDGNSGRSCDLFYKIESKRIMIHRRLFYSSLNVIWWIVCAIKQFKDVCTCPGIYSLRMAVRPGLSIKHEGIGP